MDVVRSRAAESEACGALVGGILVLGDARFNTVLEEAWNQLDREGKRALARAHTNVAMHTHIQFLINRLRECTDDQLFGSLAGTLGFIARLAGEYGVFDAERVIPTSACPEEPVRVKHQWTKEEYASVIGDSIKALVEAEDPTSGRVMPEVAQIWGVVPSVEVLEQENVAPLVAWALVNPHGPTLMGIAIKQPDSGPEVLLSFSLNPFQYRVTESTTQMNAEGHASLARELSRDSIDDLGILPLGSPTLFLRGSSMSESDANAVFHEVLRGQDDLVESRERLARFPGNPWGRISEEVSRGLGDALQRIADQSNGLRTPESVENSADDIDAYLKMVRDIDHMSEELSALGAAWQGAIDFQSNVGADALARTALSMDRFANIAAKFAASDPLLSSDDGAVD
ncbi:MAG: hypothetical protein R3F21_18605 [Myxococcota bacterium]